MDYDDIDLGDVLLLHCGFCNPPKPKYFIMVSKEPEPILLFINSDLNNFVRSNVNLQPCHMTIDQKNHNFLKYDSWVNCCEPCQNFSIDDIERDLKYGGKLCGKITTDSVQSIISGVESSPVVKRKIKATILMSLHSINN